MIDGQISPNELIVQLDWRQPKTPRFNSLTML